VSAFRFVLVHKLITEGRTALFNPLSSTYCLEPGTGQEVLIPLITNNSEPYHVYYTVQSLTDPDAKPERTRIHASQLIRGDRRLIHRKSGENEEDVDDYYLDGRSTPPPPSPRQAHHAGPARPSFHPRTRQGLSPPAEHRAQSDDLLPANLPAGRGAARACAGCR
jgi:hypothetical protein